MEEKTAQELIKAINELKISVNDLKNHTSKLNATFINQGLDQKIKNLSNSLSKIR